MASDHLTSAGANRSFLRFTVNELAQHWLLLLSLTGLALTGLALFASDTWLGRTLIALEGGIEARGTLHRIFAVALMLLVGWHFVYVVFTERGHRQLMEMMPRASDVRDTRDLLAYYLGRRAALPDFGRFSPMQKLQYWGAGLGSLLMVATGLVLWLHTPAMRVVPKWVLDVTAIVHGYEGLILFALLFGWHLYIVHLSPGNFPIQTTFLTGRISLENLARDHPREHRQLIGEADETDQPAAEGTE